MIALDAMEVPDMIKAPAKAENGRNPRWSSPTTIRAICGPTRPKNATAPTNDTATAASSDTPTNTVRRRNDTFNPRLAGPVIMSIKTVMMSNVIAPNSNKCSDKCVGGS